MIKSKFGLLGCFSLSIEVFFFLTLTILTADTTLSYFLSYDIIPKTDRGKNQGTLLLIGLFSFTIFLLRILIILKLYKSVSIDNANKTICFKNILTRQMKLYSMTDFDGYNDSIRNSTYGSHKEILFVQNNIITCIISSEYNSNYNELLSAIKEINYLGTFDYNILDKVGMLFNRRM